MRLSIKPALVATLSTCLMLSSPAFAFSELNDQLDAGIDLYDDHRFENAADVLNELVSDRGFRRLDATEKRLALSHLISALVEQGTPKEALPHTRTLLKTVKSGFGKTSEEHAKALLLKTVVEYRMRKDRDAIKTAEQTAEVLEDLGPDYLDEFRDVRLIPSKIRKREWSEKRLLKDLSDFYTKCEAISAGANLPGVSRTMHEYELVGRDYRPKGRMKNTFKTTYIKRARESSSDRSARLIFIPDDDHLDHWCVVYPDGKLVDRAFAVPPED